ncbi:helicase-like transcription factor HLTF/DNA helicase RAD5DEAD box protein-box superfamily [Aphelenchoides avenae]|nr:helicase-like transcription factor HLTF/DNA helicase RAD5DEAD box protein-box superfamily [Aphelenchus avenae]
MANTATVRYLLARCDGTLEPLRRQFVSMPADTSVQQLIDERIGKMLRLVLGTARKDCRVAGFIVTMNIDGEDAPTSLYLEQWPVEVVADRQQLEIIFVEEGYDLPLRDVESVLVLEDCLKPTPLPGPGDMRPSDNEAPDGSSAKRQRTESEADPPSTPALDAHVMRAVLGQSPVSTVVSDADGTPRAVAKTPESTAPPQQEPSLSLTTPPMSFDEPALRKPTQADTPEREFVEDQQEYWEDTPQQPLSDGQAGTAKGGNNGIDEEEEEETYIDEQEAITDTEEEAEESELDNVCEEAQEDRDESLTSDDGSAYEDSDSSAAQSSATSFSEESSDDEDGYAIPHIEGLFREDLEDGESDYVQPASDDELSEADDEFTDDELMSGDDEVIIAGEARIEEALKWEKERGSWDKGKKCRRCRKLCWLRNSTEGRAKFDFKAPTEPSISQPATFRGSVTLYPHQLTGMEWMEVREQYGNCRGGILADAPGCGKTVTVGGHLSRQKLTGAKIVPRLRFDNDGSDSEIDVDADPEPARGALVVTPKAVIEQWKEQLTKTFMRRNALRVCMFYENERDKISDDMLATYDLVLTTFTTLQVDVLGYRRNGKPKGRLSQFRWSRVILDEAHQTKTESYVARDFEQQRLTKLKACCAIVADMRWCVTGTPMDGRVEHLNALFKFLKIPRGTPKEELMLMRTKEGVVDVEKIWHPEDIVLETVERRFYNQMADFIKKWKDESALNRKWVSENRAPIEAKIARSHRKPDSECTRQSDKQKHVEYWMKLSVLAMQSMMQLRPLTRRSRIFQAEHVSSKVCQGAP